ncbi:MAG: hypothetical protein AAFQ61_10965 [Cyanobacteria bacterium J06626_23]
MKRPPFRNRKLSCGLGWVLLLVSVGLHGLALMLPMRPLGKLQLPEQKAMPPLAIIPVTQRPAVTEPEPPARTFPAPLAEPPNAKEAAQPFDEIVIEDAVEEAPIANEDEIALEPALSPETPDTDLLTPVSEPELSTDPLPADPLPTDPPLESGAVVPFADDFPHMSDVQIGCYGINNCGLLSNIGSYRSAARYLIAELQNQGYQVSDHLTDEPGYLVYSVSNPSWRDGQTFYLSIFSDGLGRAVYVITLEVISLEALRQLG